MNEDELLALVKAAAKRETAPPELAERVLEGVAYRQRLEAPLRAARARRLRAVSATAVVLAAAAAWLLFRRAPLPAILPEPMAAGSRPAPSASVKALPIVDPCRARVSARGDAATIDDFEDGDDGLPPLEGRAGFWRWARESDAPGTAPALLPVPRPAAARGNRLALHVKGGRLFDWGATVEVNFKPPCYDATKYAGIAVSARGPGRIYVSLREVDVIPPFEGGTCTDDCYNGHVAKLELGRNFQSFEIPWAELHQRGIGKPSLDPSRLHSIAFLIRAEDTPYDVWLDDVKFVPRAP